jgi:hypothetical protein
MKSHLLSNLASNLQAAQSDSGLRVETSNGTYMHLVPGFETTGVLHSGNGYHSVRGITPCIKFVLQKDF